MRGHRLHALPAVDQLTRLDEQAAALLEREPDVVGLQEISARSWPRWSEALAGAGLAHNRLDHILVSPDVAVERCEYRHEWRTSGLSDHSGLEADLRP